MSAGHPKDFVSLADWSAGGVRTVLERARELKRRRAERVAHEPLRGCSVVLYFEKPSLRTYVTFGVGISELGGTPVYLPPGQARFGEREPVEDVARNLSRWCHAVVARTFSHQLVVDLARYASIPVINALTDHLHPCQAVADVLTMMEQGARLSEERLVYMGDGNNVSHSLMHIGGLLGMRVCVCTPPEYAPDPGVVACATELAKRSGGQIYVESDPRQAIAGARFVYTDTWASMGQEAEAQERAAALQPYQVNDALLAEASPSVQVMHCLPAHRGEEITAEVADSSRSLIFEQAENRLHAQKAILELLLTP